MTQLLAELDAIVQKGQPAIVYLTPEQVEFVRRNLGPANWQNAISDAEKKQGDVAKIGMVSIRYSEKLGKPIEYDMTSGEAKPIEKGKK